MTAPMLNDEVAIQDHRLHLRQEGIFAIDMTPADLHHPDVRVAEVVDYVREEIGSGDEIRVEDGHEFAGRQLETVFKCTRLEAVPVLPVDVMDVEALLPIAFNAGGCNFSRTVARVIENLDFEQFARIADVTYMFHQPFDDIHFVIDWQLNRDTRPLLENALWLGDLIFVFQIEVYKVVSMDTVNRQHKKNREIRKENKNIERREPIQTVPMVDRRQLVEVALFGRNDDAQHQK